MLLARLLQAARIPLSLSIGVAFVQSPSITHAISNKTCEHLHKIENQDYPVYEHPFPLFLHFCFEFGYNGIQLRNPVYSVMVLILGFES